MAEHESNTLVSSAQALPPADPYTLEIEAILRETEAAAHEATAMVFGLSLCARMHNRCLPTSRE
jgi:hypothetical protein